ncbi:MAG: BREX-1 system adenine-specific DNA-methyltransferase PglX [Candidatus Tenebribacter davisii]|nr:BREX-1 system adenine-specific DNA-methyltransferase PglX [Candidatus Tenebribacter davisii]
MNTTALKRFAQQARKQLLEQVGARLDRVLALDNIEARERAAAVRELRQQIEDTSRQKVIDRVAYIWFNRFCALRFMDVNQYTRIGTVSPAAGFTQPEMLQEAKQGHIDEDLESFVNTNQVFDLLTGKAPSAVPQQEAYRMLLVAVCNYYHTIMPFMFERIADYTELLMPDDLLSESSVLQEVREAMTADNCQDVEIIGWLYQYYISERKDEVFAALKNNKKIGAEDIPAATQLFTPHWIVQYLTENSLGRLWMMNHPNSKLIDSMEYYIKPESEVKDFLKISSPEELRICDPDCGSGHILVYAFDLLYKIYEEEGYNSKDIPYLIIEKNLYGIEIDERAGELAAFALVMKARDKYRRFFRDTVQPNICVLENIKFDEDELNEYISEVGVDLFSKGLKRTLLQFEDCDTYGSLIQPEVADVNFLLQRLYTTNLDEDVFLAATHVNVIKALQQAEYLSPRYHVVVANPPYMGGKGMTQKLKKYLQDNYTEVKSDLFSAFVVRNLDMTLEGGQLGFMTPFVWMFISSYEKMRQILINKKTITSLVQLEYSGFEGATVPICTFTLENASKPEYKGGYVKLSDFRGSNNQAPKTLEAINNPDCGWFFRASSADFKKIPGSPIAYWISENTRSAFSRNKYLGTYAFSDGKNITGDNNQYQRYFWEVSCHSVGNDYRWVFISKGGGFKKWVESRDVTIDWSDHARKHYRKSSIGRIISEYIWFRKGITWGLITSSLPSFRLLNTDFTFSDVGLFFYNDDHIPSILAFLNSKVAYYFLSILNPTLNYPMEVVLKLPVSNIVGSLKASDLYWKIQKIHQSKVARVENTWNFTRIPLLYADYHQSILRVTYQKLRNHWGDMTLEIQMLEEENNRIFIKAFGLDEEFTPEVPLKEITLTCNPYYRYGKEADQIEPNTFPINDDLESRLLADTMKELISYAVGCMFGRYSLDKIGLILANQEETIRDYLAQISEPSYTPDEDNVIPILEGNWFTDDIVERFLVFLRVSFGEEHYEENLQFIEDAIGKDIRKYFLRDFYDDHIKRYKKRPIYWMFSSPKGSFNALIYMHRYRPDTISIILNDYLREFRTKLIARKEHLDQVSISMSASQKEKTSALKELDSLKKIITELNDYEKEVLYPLATEQIEIDLDDGVKVNYNKFDKALKKVTGLSGK